VGVDTSEALKTACPQPKAAQVRDPGALIVTNDHICHMTLAGHQQGHLSFDFVGNGRDLTGQFMGNDFTGGYSAAVKILKSLLLAGL
jgi:hypothetical protein